MNPYPTRAAERDRWILARRPERVRLDPRRAYASFLEHESGPDGEAIPTAALFLTNRECPFRCVMCDLWRHTLEETVPPGALAAQIRDALETLPPARRVKLYNAGSFFDPRAVPPAEHAEIARLCAPFERVIVECHPAFVGPACAAFRDLLADAPPGRPRLEVAMGLETAHPEVLARLNKRMTLDQFQGAAERLRGWDIPLRVFILLRPPWMSERDGIEWAVRSSAVAFACGAERCVLIPTRDGNGAMEALSAEGAFMPPSLAAAERALAGALRLGRGRVELDLWDVDRFRACARCDDTRIARLRRMNREQRPLDPTACRDCEGIRR